MTENEIRARAVREAAAYIDRIHKKGLVPLAIVLADLESAAWRMEQGMTARGSLRQRRADVEVERRQGIPDTEIATTQGVTP